MDDRLRRVADSLGGVFCSADAHVVGLDDQQVDLLVRNGEVVRVRRGTFVVADALRRASPEEAFALRVRSVLRARGSEVAASHQSAAVLHGAPLFRVDLTHIDLVSDVTRRRTKAGVTTYPERAYRVVDVDGWRAVTLETALVQLASAGVTSAVVAMDAALHHRRCTVEGLTRAADLLPQRHVRSALRAVSLADSSSESVGETLTRLLLDELGFRVRAQVEIRDRWRRLVGRVDFLVDDLVVVEFDGALKYGGAHGREALVAEKRRESSLTELGYEVVRVVWSDLDDPASLLRRIRAALGRAALRRSA